MRHETLRIYPLQTLLWQVAWYRISDMLHTITAAHPVVFWKTALHYLTFLVAKIWFNYLRPRILPVYFACTNKTYIHFRLKVLQHLTVVKLAHFHKVKSVNILKLCLATVESKVSSHLSLKFRLMSFAFKPSHSVHIHNTVANS